MSGKWKGIQGGWPRYRSSVERAVFINRERGFVLAQGIEGASTQSQMLFPASISSGVTGLNDLRPPSSFRAEAKKKKESCLEWALLFAPFSICLQYDLVHRNNIVAHSYCLPTTSGSAGYGKP